MQMLYLKRLHETKKTLGTLYFNPLIMKCPWVDFMKFDKTGYHTFVITVSYQHLELDL